MSGPSFADTLSVAKAHGKNSLDPDAWTGLAALYPFNQGGGKKLYDVAGHDLDGTLTNMDPATDWVATEMGWTLEFDGVDQYIALPTIGITTEFTFSAWIYHATTGMETVFGMGYDAAEGVLFVVNDWNIQFRVGSSESNYRVVVTVPSLQNRWAHVCARWKKGAFTNLVVDGIYSGNALTAYDSAFAPSDRYRIGDTDDRDYPWEGKLTDLALWSRTLLLSESQHLYTAPWDMLTPRPLTLPAAAVPSSSSLLLRLQTEGLFVGSTA